MNQSEINSFPGSFVLMEILIDQPCKLPKLSFGYSKRDKDNYPMRFKPHRMAAAAASHNNGETFTSPLAAAARTLLV